MVYPYTFNIFVFMISLTQLTQELTEVGTQKVQNFLKNQLNADGQQEPEDDFWERLGLPNPNGDDNGSEKSIPEGIGELVEGVDYEMVKSPAFTVPFKIELIVSYRKGSEVFLDSGVSFIVGETPEEVKALMDGY